MSSRYIVYFENLASMDNRMSSRLDSQLRNLLSAWRPKDAFEKKLQSHLWQFKWSPSEGSGVRAFSGHFDGDSHDIALVLVTFKKKNERNFNAAQAKFNSRSKSYADTVLAEKSKSQIESWLAAQRENASRKVLNEEAV